MKTCVGCKETKPESEFSPDKRKKDGLYARCKSCRVEVCRDHREANRDKVRESAREYGRKNSKRVKENVKNWRGRNRFSVSLQQSRAAAKKRGHKPCSATAEELEALYTGDCHICGVPEMECRTFLCLDHDHETGEVRGFLCGKCNKMLGLSGDNKSILLEASRYLMARVKQHE